MFADFFDAVRNHLNDASDGELYGVCALLKATKAANKRVFLLGNGGSAAIVSHVAVDLLRVHKMRATPFHDPSLITCLANDDGFDHWMASAIYGYADEGDLAIFVSSSGRSQDICVGLGQAKMLKMPTITLTGFDADNPVRKSGDLNLWCDSRNYNLVETVHQTWLLGCIERMKQP